ncbi:MAG TPA: sigma 54 modulation/S30EA ribosomal C-terminal domain-containing protein [Solirubrobacteraceae bacterium]|nr:sigma 54 modulation/S30EA ribosomal C-terminal domain-containing protein [Solirubrobacteraceae bacterium]
MAVERQDIVVTTRGEVAARSASYAAEKVGRVLDRAPMPVLHVRVELHRHPDPSLQRPSVATASVDVNGQPVRAQASAATMEEAIDLLEARLRRRFEVMSSRLGERQRRSAVTAAGEWRHGDLPASRPAFYPRSADEREMVHRKTFDDEPLAVEDAAHELYLLDYDFLLFVDPVAGVDSLAYRPDGGGFLRIARASQPAQEEPQSEGSAPISDPNPAPDLTVAQARQRLDANGEHWVFFRDPATGRGCVIYRRLDGHYGLITPSAPPA